MKLDDNYSVKKEGECVTLYYEEKRYDESKKKIVTSKNQWYFNNMASALKKYANNIVDCSDSIQDAIKRIGELDSRITSLC